MGHLVKIGRDQALQTLDIYDHNRKAFGDDVANEILARALHLPLNRAGDAFDILVRFVTDDPSLDPKHPSQRL